MTDVLTAYQELQAAQAAADALIEKARVNFGRAIHEARFNGRRRVKQDDIAEKVGLKRERLRQIEKLYTDTLPADS